MSTESPEQEKLTSAYDESGIVCRTHVGGQALIEGIMMRGKYNWAVAVRKPDGTIHVEEHDLASGKDKNSWMYKPVVRGCTAMVESLGLGYKALEIAANHAYDYEEDEEEPTVKDDDAAQPEVSLLAESVTTEAVAAEGISTEGKPLKNTDTVKTVAVAAAEVAAGELAAAKETVEKHAAKEAAAKEAVTHVAATEEAVTHVAAAKEASSKEAVTHVAAAKEAAGKEHESSESALPKGLMTVSMVVGILLGVALFIIVPAVVTNLLVGDYGEKTLLWNIVDGILRVAIFIGYIFLIGRMSDIKRMFGYHGAEHRTIHCYERGKELTVTNAQSYPSLHVRCGTAFMLMTMIIAILVFTIVPINWLIDGLGIQNEVLRLIVVILSRIVLLPLIAGLSYEFTVKWAGSRPDNPIVKVVLWPGLQMQRLTTNPPDDDMVECAIAAMNAVLAREELEAKKAAQESEALVSGNQLRTPDDQVQENALHTPGELGVENVT